MRYIVTLLKDLPEFPKGTKFYYKHEYEFSPFCHSIDIETYAKAFEPTDADIPYDVMDNPEWCRKVVDYSSSMDLKCPECGETRGHIKVGGIRVGNNVDGFHCSADVYFEYDCGHELRKLYDAK